MERAPARSPPFSHDQIATPLCIMSAGKTIRACLACCGIEGADAFIGCASTDEEFARIKKSYMKLVLVVHPDKGGDAAAFIELRDCWETVRELYDQGKVHLTGFGHYTSAAGATDWVRNEAVTD